MKHEQSEMELVHWQRFLFLLSLVFLGAALSYAAGVLVRSLQGSARVSVVFEMPAHDFGEVLRTDFLEHRFVFENHGRNPIIIQKVVPGCGSCIRVVDYTRSAVVRKGKGYVTLQLLSTGLPSGQTSQAAIVMSNDPLVPALLLVMNARIVEDKDNVTK